jgi:hypothetical protein
MNLRRKLERLESQREALNPCPACAHKGGIRVAMLEGDEPFDDSDLDCPHCGAPCRFSMVVRLAGAAAGEGAS